MTTTATAPQLPAEFAELQPFAEKWVLPDEPARYKARLSTSMEEMQVFYDAVSAKGEEIITFLSSLDLYDLPEDAYNLLTMMYAYIIVTFSIEAYHSPRIPDTGATEMWYSIEPIP